MEFRNVGRSGLSVSLVGLGCNNFGGRIDFDASRKVVHRALDAGITLFDTADTYGNRGNSEKFLGDLLGARRKDIVLASKFGMAMDDAGTMKGGSRRYIVSAVEASLARLRTDWIDLYQLHQPDPSTPIEETLRALDDLVRAGKVRHIGCSNLPGWQVTDAAWTSLHHGLAPFVSAQDEYSLLHRNHEPHLFPALERFGMGFLPYYPLAGGLLTGKYRKDAPLPEGARLTYFKPAADKFLNERNWQRVQALQAFADARGRTLNELAFAWLASKPLVSSVIAGATNPDQIDGNIAAAAWRLSGEEMDEVNRITA
jgi:aryl-alcohol dehydrogenase-like predicted oxidoreductase